MLGNVSLSLPPSLTNRLHLDHQYRLVQNLSHTYIHTALLADYFGGGDGRGDRLFIGEGVCGH